MNIQQRLNLLEGKQAVIGIDIAKHTHYANIIEKNTLKSIETIKIENTKDGFEKFYKKIKKWNINQVIIGMEPTGHYWKVINNWLVEKGFRTVLVNPYHTRLQKELFNNMNNKNDIKDSQIIARMVANATFLDVLTIEEIYDELKQLSIAREALIKSLAQQKIRLKVLLDEFIPEYCSCFKDPSRKTSFKLLEMFSLSGLTNNKKKKAKAKLINTTSRKVIDKEKSMQIVETLSNSVGIKMGIKGAEHRLRIIIEQIKFYKKEIEVIEKELKIYLEKTSEAKYMLSMKGVGIVTLSAFLGQTGRLDKFSHPNQLLKFAGVIPVQQKSGKFEGQTKLSKRGNSKLRNAVYRIAVSLISNNAEMKRLYKYKINSLKKKKLVALTSIAAKTLKILFKLGKNKILYEAKFIENILVNA